MRLVMSGGSGQIGRMLARHFQQNGHAVTVLCRHPKPALWKTVKWNAQDLGAWTNEIDGADVVINLAGRSVDARYNPATCREIKESRTRSTTLIGQAIAQAAHPPALWMRSEEHT